MTLAWGSVLFQYLALLTGFVFIGSDGLKNVLLKGPYFLRRGEDISLRCEYDMEGESLYAVKWYYGSQEFYRYMPKEVPPQKVFYVHDHPANIDIQKSDRHQILFRNVSFYLSGSYKCVVSAESTFQTLTDVRNIVVVSIGYNTPQLHLDRVSYHPGDLVQANCTVGRTFPSPNITWLVNDVEDPLLKDKTTAISSPDKRDPPIITTISQLRFTLPESYLPSKLSCKVSMLDIYSEVSAKRIQPVPRNYTFIQGSDASNGIVPRTSKSKLPASSLLPPVPVGGVGLGVLSVGATTNFSASYNGQGRGRGYGRERSNAASFMDSFSFNEGSDGLKNVILDAPRYVRAGEDENINLSCQYDIDTRALYAVKWYRGPDEFARFLPKEIPPQQVFSQKGIHVNVTQLTEHQIVLTNVTQESSGIYKCVVSAETTFKTLSDDQEVDVVVVGYESPKLFVDQVDYSPGDIARANCSIERTSPPINITWFIDNLRVPTSKPVTYLKPDPLVPGTITSISILTFPLPETSTFVRLKCTGQLYSIYDMSSEMTIPLRPRRVSMMSTSKDTLARRHNGTGRGSAQQRSSEINHRCLLVSIAITILSMLLLLSETST